MYSIFSKNIIQDNSSPNRHNLNRNNQQTAAWEAQSGNFQTGLWIFRELANIKLKPTLPPI